MSNGMAQPGSRMAASGSESEGLFAQLIYQQAHMALMMLGKAANPQTGAVDQDLDGARFFIDQLEMIENKTRGNLTTTEQGYLKETLMSLRLAYVAAVESPQAGEKKEEEKTEAAPEAGPGPSESAPATGAVDAGGEEHKKKFSKKY
jgi:hypothetical protein